MCGRLDARDVCGRLDARDVVVQMIEMWSFRCSRCGRLDDRDSVV